MYVRFFLSFSRIETFWVVQHYFHIGNWYKYYEHITSQYIISSQVKPHFAVLCLTHADSRSLSVCPSVFSLDKTNAFILIAANWFSIDFRSNLISINRCVNNVVDMTSATMLFASSTEKKNNNSKSFHLPLTFDLTYFFFSSYCFIVYFSLFKWFFEIITRFFPSYAYTDTWKNNSI